MRLIAIGIISIMITGCAVRIIHEDPIRPIHKQLFSLYQGATKDKRKADRGKSCLWDGNKKVCVVVGKKGEE